MAVHFRSFFQIFGGTCTVSRCTARLSRNVVAANLRLGTGRAIVDFAASGAHGAVRNVTSDLGDEPLVVGADLGSGSATVQRENGYKEAYFEAQASEHRTDPRHRRSSANSSCRWTSSPATTGRSAHVHRTTVGRLQRPQSRRQFFVTQLIESVGKI